MKILNRLIVSGAVLQTHLSFILKVFVDQHRLHRVCSIQYIICYSVCRQINTLYCIVLYSVLSIEYRMSGAEGTPDMTSSNQTPKRTSFLATGSHGHLLLSGYGMAQGQRINFIVWRKLPDQSFGNSETAKHYKLDIIIDIMFFLNVSYYLYFEYIYCAPQF